MVKESTVTKSKNGYDVVVKESGNGGNVLKRSVITKSGDGWKVITKEEPEMVED